MSCCQSGEVTVPPATGGGVGGYDECGGSGGAVVPYPTPAGSLAGTAPHPPPTPTGGKLQRIGGLYFVKKVTR